MNFRTKTIARTATLYLLATGLTVASWTTAVTQESLKNFIMHKTPRPISVVKFEDAQSKRRTIADFRGKVVLLNVWATWCVPCRKEMPALDRLQAALMGASLELVALSIDRGGVAVVRTFFEKFGIQKLAIYIDSSAKAKHELNIVGLPTTLLIDRDGREIGRLIGPAEWDSREMIKFIKGKILNRNTAQSRKRSAAVATTPRGGRGLDISDGR
jgi:thiol-disulfide isomerase/thioredoxin